MQYARAAFRFDLSSITDTVAKAELQLTVKSGLSNGTEICTLFTINSQWNSSECSWFYASEGKLWDEPGCDFDRNNFITAQAATPFTPLESYDVTKMVNAIIKGEKENYGFVIEPATSEDLLIQMKDHIYYSSESDSIDKRPALILNDEVAISKNFKDKIKLANICDLGDRIIFTSLKSDFTISIYDLKGREVIQLSSKNYKNEISLNKKILGKGLFIASFRNNSSSEKFTLTIN